MKKKKIPRRSLVFNFVSRIHLFLWYLCDFLKIHVPSIFSTLNFAGLRSQFDGTEILFLRSLVFGLDDE